MKLTLVLTLFALLASALAAQAQVLQGLGAADPSQQLKSSGMIFDMSHPHFPMTTNGDRLGAPDPLITVIEPSSAPRVSRRAQARAQRTRRTVRQRIERADRGTLIEVQ